ncbi:MAG: DUF2249 domain-containing protein [Hymenobacteraceae bacterium]|nr:DUF2249 domain-containing protein [Hymenobacteraceae bacterium]MDX5396447.1 DUF2249 domain-containing protein [Hymenobacteraceae bacterium]MDX5442571.1 DUF2249 domain-containing protein [Hymenobacteraceae bacterium]MDX5512508.1 DUF2249 domain-containing protein [Hymenobacteraceae bacterium]
MKITPATKISTIIKANPAAIEAIASISAHFEKLRNPLLRKILASRVTIADAARIGGAEIAVFFEKLEAIGFEAEYTSAAYKEATQVSEETAIPQNVVVLDVREALQSGNDPFNEIMEAVEQLEPAQALQLINTFEPTPLISILKKRGYSYLTRQQAPDLFFIYFFKNDKKTQPTPAEAPAQAKEISFENLLEQYEGKLAEVDVRNLEMPLPMTTILEALPRLQPEQALYVHHRRVPQYLLPQLQERGFAYAVSQLTDNDVKLIIYKEPQK